MKIIYFAWIKDITNFPEELLDSNKIKNLDNLKKYIISKYPDLKKHLDQEILRFAVNQEYIVENIDLKKDDEIAVFPPVSGG
ncbi:molybdopterin converting factor subunit 1 [Alphaproteobacteria bacterium]|nr:molybdopterin converting factor subunit 1 [Alphaproteobacteria bacterium]